MQWSIMMGCRCLGCTLFITKKGSRAMRIVTESGVSQEAGMRVVGGVTEGIFPQIEKWLNEHVDGQRALRHVAIHKGMNRYVSMVDFLFCETFFGFKDDCFRFYEKTGPALNGLPGYTEQLRMLWERQLLTALEYSVQVFRDKRDTTWNRFRLEFLQIEHVAA